MTLPTPPISPLRTGDERPAWMQIDMLFQRHGLEPPPYRLRDELVNHLAWALFGWSRRSVPAAPPAPPAPTDEEDFFGAPERWLEPEVLDPEGGADVWVWLTEQTNLELSFQYPDMEGEPGAWMVHRVTGNLNDREWDQVGCGATALEAVQAARANLPTEGGESHDR